MNLKSKFEKNGYEYELLYSHSAKDGCHVWCIYAQKLDGVLMYHELQKVRKCIATGKVRGYNEGEEYYRYPADSDWGVSGWTLRPDVDYISRINNLLLDYKS